MMRRTVVVASLMMSVLGMTDAHAARTMTLRYIGAGFDTTCGSILNAGSSCDLPLQGGESVIDIELTDELNANVAFSIRDAGDRKVTIASGCGSATSVRIPANVDSVFVEFAEVTDAAPAGCEVGTLGELTLTFR